MQEKPHRNGSDCSTGVRISLSLWRWDLMLRRIK
jgi:hypothetical protein